VRDANVKRYTTGGEHGIEWVVQNRDDTFLTGAPKHPWTGQKKQGIGYRETGQMVKRGGTVSAGVYQPDAARGG
jgi:hypothetical protein